MTRLPTDHSPTCPSFLASKLNVDYDLSNLPNLPGHFLQLFLKCDNMDDVPSLLG
jgi:hypothetical protein